MIGHESPGAALGRSRRRILIADHDWEFAASVAEALVAAGHVTQLSSRGDEAINLALADPPDLILLDLRLPLIDGLRVAERLARSSRTRGVPVLLTAGIGPHEREPWRELLAVRGWEVLFKPFRLDELLDAVGRRLAAPV